jgi:hypothetical protein
VTEPQEQIANVNRSRMVKVTQQVMRTLDQIFRRKMCFVLVVVPAGEENPEVLYTSNLEGEVGHSLLIQYLAHRASQKPTKEAKSAD